jgi:hypothetical protein
MPSKYNQILWPNSIKFHPWVGENYHTGRGPNSKKILFVGESHYSDETTMEPHQVSNFTIDCINEVAGKVWTHRFFTAIPTMTEGKIKDNIDLPAFWSTVAFYNFLQGFLLKSRDGFDIKLIEAARPIFQEIIDRLEPDCIVAMSSGLFKWWLPSPENEVPLMVGGENHGARIYRTSSGQPCLLTWTYHPSTSQFGSWADWHPVVNALLAKSFA